MHERENKILKYLHNNEKDSQNINKRIHYSFSTHYFRLANPAICKYQYSVQEKKIKDLSK